MKKIILFPSVCSYSYFSLLKYNASGVKTWFGHYIKHWRSWFWYVKDYRASKICLLIVDLHGLQGLVIWYLYIYIHSRLQVNSKSLIWVWPIIICSYVANLAWQNIMYVLNLCILSIIHCISNTCYNQKLIEFVATSHQIWWKNF